MKESLPNKIVNKFGFYLFSSTLITMVPMTYITIFMTDNLLISAAVVGSVLLIARIIDFIISVVVGGIIERGRLPWGKYRSWILLVRWIIVFGVVCQFFDTTIFPIGARAIVCCIGYICMHGGMSFTTNAYYGLIPLLAGSNANDRFRLSARGAQFMSAATLLVSALALPLITFIAPSVGMNMGYFIVAVAFAIPYIFVSQMCCNMCKEADPSGKTGRVNKSKSVAGRVTLKDMVKSVVTNGQLMVLFIAFTVFYIAMFAVSGVMAYYFTYITGNILYMSAAMTISMIVSLGAAIILPKFAGKLGKKRSFILALLIYTVGSVLIWKFAASSWIIYTVTSSINAASMYLFTSFGVNYFLDAGEYYLYKTGKNTKDIAISMYSVPMKVGMALGGAIATYGLAAINYTAGMEVTAGFVSDFMILLGIIPAVFTLIGAVILAVGYKITDENAAMYAKANIEKYNTKGA
jgi:Na+/melibiose symporter-like transporter